MKKMILSFNKKRDEKLRSDFLPEAMELVEKQPSPLGHTVIYITAILVIIVILWTTLGFVDEIAIARGKVVPVDRIQVVQPANEGIVSKILINEGDTVKKGDKLIELDNSIYGIDIDKSKSSLDILQFKNDIFTRFLDNKNLDLSLFDKITVKNNSKENIVKLIDSLKNDYNSKNKEIKLEITKCEQQVSQYESNLEKSKSNLNLLQEEETTLNKIIGIDGPEQELLEQAELAVSTAKKDLNSYETLYKGDAITKEEFNKKNEEYELLKKQYNVQKSKADYEKLQNVLKLNEVKQNIELTRNDINTQDIQVEQAKSDRERAANSLATLNDETQTKIMDIIVSNDAEIENTKADIALKTKNFDNQVLYAPVDGIIQSISTNTIGSVVTPTQQLVTIVPVDSVNIVEAYLPNKDIGFVSVKQKASIKLDTFSFQKYGMVEGEVIEISPDAISDEELGLVYRVKILLDKNTIFVENKDVQISSGMQCTVEIKTGKRRIIEFFFSSLVEYFDSSLSLR